MGCDIHSLIRTKQNNRWYIEELNPIEGRDYELFGLLAGVRGTMPPLYERKGLPLDLKVTTYNSDAFDNAYIKENYSNDFWVGCFGFSYLNLTELDNLQLYYKSMCTSHDCPTCTCLEKALEQQSLKNIIKCMSKYKYIRGMPNEDIQLVFGFDS